MTGDVPHRFVIHDRDSIFSKALDGGLRAMGLRVLKTPRSTPQANAICERLIGTARRECLDFMIPLNERHLRRTLAEWVAHYNHGRPHASLGPGIPDPIAPKAVVRSHYQVPSDHRVATKLILGGLHHEYRLEPLAA